MLVVALLSVAGAHTTAYNRPECNLSHPRWLRHEPRTHYRRRSALLGRSGRGFARRADCPKLAGPSRPPVACPVRHASFSQLPAFDAPTVELAGRRVARRRGG